MRPRLSAQILVPTILAALMPLGCVTTTPESPSLSVGEVARLIPERVKDREGWAEDIIKAIEAVDKDPTAERVCAVIAVIEQESGYQVDPAVAHLPRIVREGILKKFARLGPLAEPAMNALLDGKAPGTDVTFAKRIDKLRTEQDLDRLFRDIASTYREKFPGSFVIASAMSRLLGKGGLDNLNPVTTAGSMQVKVSYARTIDDFDSLSDASVRELLYTRAGGVRAGTARLLDYPAAYDDIVYRFADYNAGVYASRNAAFQEQLAAVTGRTLIPDGDLLAYADDGDRKDLETKSLQAMLVFGINHDMRAGAVQRAARKEKSDDFEDTSIWEEVRAAWKSKTGKEPPYARIPNVTLTSPKLSRDRSTAWFANNVKKRYEACRSRG